MNAITPPASSSHLHRDRGEGGAGAGGTGFLGGSGPAVIGPAGRIGTLGRTCSLGSKHRRQSPGSNGKRGNHARQRRARMDTARLAATRRAMVSS